MPGHEPSEAAHAYGHPGMVAETFHIDILQIKWFSSLVVSCWLQVLVTDPKELEKIRERESDITRERIEKILAAGANVVLTTKGIDDMALKVLCGSRRNCGAPCSQRRSQACRLQVSNSSRARSPTCLTV